MRESSGLCISHRTVFNEPNQCLKCFYFSVVCLPFRIYFSFIIICRIHLTSKFFEYFRFWLILFTFRVLAKLFCCCRCFFFHSSKCDWCVFVLVGSFIQIETLFGRTIFSSAIAWLNAHIFLLSSSLHYSYQIHISRAPWRTVYQNANHNNTIHSNTWTHTRRGDVTISEAQIQMHNAILVGLARFVIFRVRTFFFSLLIPPFQCWRRCCFRRSVALTSNGWGFWICVWVLWFECFAFYCPNKSAHTHTRTHLRRAHIWRWKCSNSPCIYRSMSYAQRLCSGI